MNNQIVAALITVAGTLFGVWIGSNLSRKSSKEAIEASNRNAIDIMKRQEFNRAASLFRAAFTNELIRLQSFVTYNKSVSEETILDLLKSADIKLNNACIIFKHHLSEPLQVSFDKTWREYCHPKGGDPKLVPDPYLEYFINVPIQESINLIIEKIEKLLQFAKPI